MRAARKRCTTLAWGVSLAVHGLLLAALLWWVDAVLVAPKPQETPVPLQLSMVAAPVPKPMEQLAEPVIDPPPQVEPEPVVEPPPVTPEPVPEPAPVVKPKSPVPKPEPQVKTENKPKPKPESRPESKPASVQPAPSVVEAQAENQIQPVAAPVLAAAVPENAAALADAEADYKARVRQAVDAHKQYPKMARRMGEQGKVVVEFSVDASGVVSSVQIKHSSGSERLDEAALQAVRDAAPFPPFPDEVKRNRWHFTLPLSFSLDS